jgi:hypothetical protein
VAGAGYAGLTGPARRLRRERADDGPAGGGVVPGGGRHHGGLPGHPLPLRPSGPDGHLHEVLGEVRDYGPARDPSGRYLVTATAGDGEWRGRGRRHHGRRGHGGGPLVGPRPARAGSAAALFVFLWPRRGRDESPPPRAPLPLGGGPTPRAAPSTGTPARAGGRSTAPCATAAGARPAATAWLAREAVVLFSRRPATVGHRGQRSADGFVQSTPPPQPQARFPRHPRPGAECPLNGAAPASRGRVRPAGGLSG